ncbi:hypothetical protein NF700_11290 [Sphingomonadaceae bacterium OTU29MARTA1]|uniref:hypothetical protein n=1 Tax=Sphingomonas sp. Leaf37 TaxID=2876552 RepID=UPI001E2B5AE8|nr:hypothetical protein [Sphingomonas sp. Leaf37]USU03954.1 hypothetical protein NF699_12870 [Sphingomonadaceae bacterium OTU29LAMAA1]USU07685.1 hypothetical protein NF700_11290 [Sphingomonadaceae bacterium OTU29MARTA1]USU11176.1 hypothetical protein NF701_11465 [Sphingomonadaceae bacterium OTU29THOMA1]
MTSGALQDLFLSTLVRKAGGNRRRWRLVLGDMKVYAVATHPHCNWSVTPTGSAAENDIVERIADDLRVTHPIVSHG